jgi:hypothetical protein
VYVDGGIDTLTAEAMVAYTCGITLPRNNSGTYVGMLDSCGGHTEEYHFHERKKPLPLALYRSFFLPRYLSLSLSTPASFNPLALSNFGPPGLNCLYHEAGNHSTQVGESLDGDQYLYGKWEDYAQRTMPTLDACGGHYGFTPDSPATSVYHYHVQ